MKMPKIIFSGKVLPLSQCNSVPSNTWVILDLNKREQSGLKTNVLEVTVVSEMESNMN